MNRKLASCVNGKTIAIAALAVVLLVAALAAATGALAASNSLEGVWLVTITPPDQPTQTNVTAFHGGGSVTMMEINGELGIGVWSKKPGGGYAFTAWEYWQEGTDFYQAEISGTAQVSKGGEEYTGPSWLKLYMNGNLIVEGDVPATAVRMHVK